jgi:hypothetical protein
MKELYCPLCGGSWFIAVQYSDDTVSLICHPCGLVVYHIHEGRAEPTQVQPKLSRRIRAWLKRFKPEVEARP